MAGRPHAPGRGAAQTSVRSTAGSWELALPEAAGQRRPADARRPSRRHRPCVAFSPDGRRLAAASWRRDRDGLGRGHRPRGRLRRWTIRRRSRRVAFSPDGRASPSWPRAGQDGDRAGSGTRPPADRSAPSAATPARSRPWPSAPTARGSPRRAQRRLVKVWDAATGEEPLDPPRPHRRGHVAWPSAPTAAASPRRASDRTAPALGRGHRQASAGALAGHAGRGQQRGLQPDGRRRRLGELRRDGAGLGRATGADGAPSRSPRARADGRRRSAPTARRIGTAGRRRPQGRHGPVAGSGTRPSGDSASPRPRSTTARWDATRPDSRRPGDSPAAHRRPSAPTAEPGRPATTTVRLWDAATGRAARPARGMPTASSSRGLQPRRQTVASADRRRQPGRATGRASGTRPRAGRSPGAPDADRRRPSRGLQPRRPPPAPARGDSRPGRRQRLGGRDGPAVARLREAHRGRRSNDRWPSAPTAAARRDRRRSGRGRRGVWDAATGQRGRDPGHDRGVSHRRGLQPRRPPARLGRPAIGRIRASQGLGRCHGPAGDLLAAAGTTGRVRARRRSAPTAAASPRPATDRTGGSGTRHRPGAPQPAVAPRRRGEPRRLQPRRPAPRHGRRDRTARRLGRGRGRPWALRCGTPSRCSRRRSAGRAPPRRLHRRAADRTSREATSGPERRSRALGRDGRLRLARLPFSPDGRRAATGIRRGARSGTWRRADPMSPLLKHGGPIGTPASAPTAAGS